MLDRFRRQADVILNPLARHVGFRANTISYLSLLCAAAAGVAFFFSFGYTALLVLGSCFVLANGFLDALDGKIARLQHQSNARGDFIDHSVDRFADVFMIGGIACSAWVDTRIGLVALTAVLLVSYLGTQAQAVGYGRLYAGILGRADRLVLLFVFPILQYLWTEPFENARVLEWLMIYFAVAGIGTALQRYVTVVRWFKHRR
jgi:archaetidylinositol phosphate synthase